MKKKIAKTLALSKETLRNLADGHAKRVAGGLTVESGCNYCQTGTCCTCVNTCWDSPPTR